MIPAALAFLDLLDPPSVRPSEGACKDYLLSYMISNINILVVFPVVLIHFILGTYSGDEGEIHVMGSSFLDFLTVVDRFD